MGDEPFAVLLPDDLIDDEGPGCLAQMVDVFAREQCSLVAVESVDPADTRRYGIVDVGGSAERVCTMRAVVEKPSPAEAPSNLGVVGRYLLRPEIFSALENTPARRGRRVPAHRRDSRGSHAICGWRPTASPAAATTAARSSVSCRQWWNSGRNIRRSAPQFRAYLASVDS